jgi:hypothetical protein
LWLGDHGARTAANLATAVHRPDADALADLRHLAAMGRVEERGGAWQLRTILSDQTAQAIANALARKTDAGILALRLSDERLAGAMRGE